MPWNLTLIIDVCNLPTVIFASSVHIFLFDFFKKNQLDLYIIIFNSIIFFQQDNE